MPKYVDFTYIANTVDKNENVLKHCPRCGGRAALEGSRKVVCAAGCGFRLYLNTAAAVAALIFDAGGRLMAIRRNREPQKGLLDLPGGFVDFGESAEEALAREISEELGVGVEAGSIEYFKSIPNTYLYGDVLYHTLDLFFTCRLADTGAIRTNDEIAEIVYKRPKEISEGEAAFDSMRGLLRLISEIP